MTKMPDPYRGFRFPAEIIAHAVWLYHGFSQRIQAVVAMCGGGGYDGQAEAGIGSIWTQALAVTGSATGCGAR